MKGQVTILFLGRRASGRTSLANYLYGRKLFDPAAPSATLYQSMPSATIDAPLGTVVIYDAPALEPDSYEEWLAKVTEVAGDSASFDTSPSAWVHADFYAISAAAQDIDERELDAVRELGQEYHIPVSVVLTNCDAADEPTIVRHTERLTEGLPGVPVYRACSVERVRRGGERIVPFGREEILAGHCEKLSFSYERRATVSYCEAMIYLYYHYFNAVKRRIHNSNLGLFSSRKDFNQVMSQAFEVDDREMLIRNNRFDRIEVNIRAVESYLADVCHASVHFNDLDRSVWNNIDTEIGKLTRSSFSFNDKNAALKYVDRLIESFSKKYNDIINVCLGELYNR